MKNKFKNSKFNVHETTSMIVLGDMSVEMMLNNNPSMELLYDPFSLSKKEFVALCKKLIHYHISTEEYMKCAELRDIISDVVNHQSLIDEITIDEQSAYVDGQLNPMNMIIDSLRGMSRDDISGSLIDLIKKDGLDQITDMEVWTILTSDDRNIFDNKYSKFYKWIKGLNDKNRDAYIDRLLNDKPLIPTEDDLTNWPGASFVEDEDEDEVDYEHNIVISFMDGNTIMSHTNLDKIKDIRKILSVHGVQSIEMRKKEIVGGTLYSLVFPSKRRPE